tara:strand:+ start:67 stop:630 length:564 start_codon:yes stop_codon:yes gene_type:complete
MEYISNILGIHMSKRPKSDLASLAVLGVSSFGLHKVNKLDKSFRELVVSQRANHQQVMRGLQSITELQVASLYMLRDVNNKLTTLSEVAWDISNYLERKEKKEDFIGNLKLIVRAIDKALDEIDLISLTNLEYATLQVEMLQALTEEHDVRIEHFKSLSFDDMDRVEGVLDRISSTHRDYMLRLEEM